MATILEQKHSIWKERKLFYVETLLVQKKTFNEIETTWITWRIE